MCEVTTLTLIILVLTVICIRNVIDICKSINVLLNHFYDLKKLKEENQNV